jgi:hypothetical protein
MASLFHVSSSANRASIRAHGLDWARMGAARGIAGSTRPEVEGCFLADEHELPFFVRMNNTGGAVDVWAVQGIAEDRLVTSPTGYRYFPGVVEPAAVTLVRPADVTVPSAAAPRRRRSARGGSPRRRGPAAE